MVSEVLDSKIDSLLTIFIDLFFIWFVLLELQKIKDLTEANGDVAFIDAVRHLYTPGYLDYLLWLLEELKVDVN